MEQGKDPGLKDSEWLFKFEALLTDFQIASVDYEESKHKGDGDPSLFAAQKLAAARAAITDHAQIRLNTLNKVESES